MVFRKRSVGQRLAGPYSAPGQTPRTIPSVIAREVERGSEEVPRAAASGNVPVSISLMFRPCHLLFLGLVNDLSQQHRAHVTAKAHPARDAGKPCFGRAAKRIRENYRGLETSAYLLRDGKERLLRCKRDHLIDFGNRIPEGGEFCRSEDGQSGVRAAEA